MKISARNVLAGTVTDVNVGAVSTEVVLRLASGDHIVATVTNAGAKSLELAPGRPATALVKANSVVLALSVRDTAISARNVLAGRVVGVKSAPVSSVVTIALRGGTPLHAALTHDAVVDLDLREGTDVFAVVKASSVVLAVSK